MVKAAAMLGFGTNNLVKVKADERFVLFLRKWLTYLLDWIKHKFSRAYGMNYVFTFKLRSFEWKIFIFSLLIVNEYVIFSPVNGKWVCFSQSYLVIVYLIILRYSTFTYSGCTRMELAECNVILFTEFYVTEYSQSVTWWL